MSGLGVLRQLAWVSTPCFTRDKVVRAGYVTQAVWRRSQDYRRGPPPRTTFVGLGFCATRNFSWFSLRSSKQVPPPPDDPQESAKTVIEVEEEYVDNVELRELTAPNPEVIPPPPTSTDNNPSDSSLLVESYSLDNVAAAASDIAPSMELGDVTSLGLVSWWSPSRAVISAFEFIHTTTHLSPWLCIFVMVATMRLLLLPVRVTSIKRVANLNPFHAELTQSKNELKKKLATASSGSPESTRVKHDAYVAYQLRVSTIHHDADVTNDNVSSALTVAQMVFSFAGLFAFTEMAQVGLPVLVHGGAWLWPDLTATDTWSLPILTALLFNIELKLIAYDMNTNDKVFPFHFLNGCKLAFVFAIPLLSSVPVAALEFLFVVTAFMTLERYILLQPAVRAYLKIAPPINPRGGIPLFRTLSLATQRRLNNKLKSQAREEYSRRPRPFMHLNATFPEQDPTKPAHPNWVRGVPVEEVVDFKKRSEDTGKGKKKRR